MARLPSLVSAAPFSSATPAADMAASAPCGTTPSRLQSINSESVFWEKVLVESSDRSVISAAVLTNSPEETTAESARFKALSTVADVDTVFTLLPEDQEEKVPVLRSIMAAVPDLDRLCTQVC